ncbi:hypothetical protein [Desulfosporosinus fructosivorans]
MNKLSKLIAASAFVMVVGLSISGASLQAKASDLVNEGVGLATKPVGVQHIMSHGEYLNSDVHQQKYLTYLVNEYLPESLGDWQAAFAERNKVEATMPKPDKVEAVSGVSYQLGHAEQIDITQDTDSAFAGPSKTIMIKLPDGTALTEPGEGKFMKALPMDQETQDKMEAEMKAAIQLNTDFEQAVASNSASAFKEVLPRVLADYQKMTQQMAKFSEQLKSDTKE